MSDPIKDTLHNLLVGDKLSKPTINSNRSIFENLRIDEGYREVYHLTDPVADHSRLKGEFHPSTSRTTKEIINNSNENKRKPSEPDITTPSHAHELFAHAIETAVDRDIAVGSAFPSNTDDNSVLVRHEGREEAKKWRDHLRSLGIKYEVEN